MLTKKSEYLNDGASNQAKAVLAFVDDDVKSSFNGFDYLASLKVGRWENCREQGYVLSLNNEDYKQQLNIAFYEHRNSNDICALEWEQNTINTPTIDKLPEGVFRDKYEYSYSVPYGEVLDMAKWINGRLNDFWSRTCKDQD